MHDGIQQYLVAISMRLDLARTLIPTDPLQAAQVAVDQRHLARQAADELRALVRRLRSPLLEKEGLVEALRQHLTLFGERTAVATELRVAGEEVRLEPRIEHALLRIVQEALTNIVKYAQATQVVVSLEFQPQAVCCMIRDDGVGFDPAQLPAEPGLTSGFGMETMHSRAAAVKGTCQVSSQPGEGTTVAATVPYRPG
jgi:two-component system sensor histidine kinase DegS